MSTLEISRNLSQRSPREAKKSLWQSLSPDFTNQLSPAHLPDTCLGAATSCACLSQSDSFASPLAAGSDLPATKKSRGFFMLFWLFITAIRASTWVVTASSSPTSLSTWLPNTFSFSKDLETTRQWQHSLQATVRPNEQTKLHWLLAELSYSELFLEAMKLRKTFSKDSVGSPAWVHTHYVSSY